MGQFCHHLERPKSWPTCPWHPGSRWCPSRPPRPTGSAGAGCSVAPGSRGSWWGRRTRIGGRRGRTSSFCSCCSCPAATRRNAWSRRRGEPSRRRRTSARGVSPDQEIDKNCDLLFFSFNSGAFDNSAIVHPLNLNIDWLQMGLSCWFGSR